MAKLNVEVPPVPKKDLRQIDKNILLPVALAKTVDEELFDLTERAHHNNAANKGQPILKSNVSCLQPVT